MTDDQPSQPLTEDSWTMMSDKFIEPIPPHPLTDAELAQIKERTAHAVTIDEMQESDADNIFDLINTVDRLRTALTAISRNENAAANRSLELQEENERLRVENARIRAELDTLRHNEQTVTDQSCGDASIWSCALGDHCVCKKTKHGGRHECACGSWWVRDK